MSRAVTFRASCCSARMAERIPSDVIRLILLRVPTASLADSVRLVNRRWKRVAEETVTKRIEERVQAARLLCQLDDRFIPMSPWVKWGSDPSIWTDVAAAQEGAAYVIARSRLSSTSSKNVYACRGKHRGAAVSDSTVPNAGDNLWRRRPPAPGM